MALQHEVISEITVGNDPDTLGRGVGLGLGLAGVMLGALLGLTILTDRLTFLGMRWQAYTFPVPGWWSLVWLGVCVAVMIAAVFLALRYVVRGSGMATTAAIVAGPSVGAELYLGWAGTVRDVVGAPAQGWLLLEQLASWWLIIVLAVGVLALGTFIRRRQNAQPPVPLLIMSAGVVGTLAVLVVSGGPPVFMRPWYDLPLWAMGLQVVAEAAVLSVLVGLMLVGVWRAIDQLRRTVPDANL